MAEEQTGARLAVGEFSRQVHGELVPLNSHFSYFAAASPFGEDEIRDYLHDPIAALPPGVIELLPPVAILLVPYLEKPNGRNGSREAAAKPGGEVVSFEQPSEARALRSVAFGNSGETVLCFAVEEMELADYHYELYRALAALVGQASKDVLQDYFGIVREELNTRVHGEVDDGSWQRKQALLRRQTHVRGDTKAFREYAQESFVDTLTLYLHGICCDIDVEPGPRQIASRHLRRRLRLLQTMYPPPSGYAVFPEDLDGAGPAVRPARRDGPPA